MEAERAYLASVIKTFDPSFHRSRAAMQSDHTTYDRARTRAPKIRRIEALTFPALTRRCVTRRRAAAHASHCFKRRHLFRDEIGSASPLILAPVRRKQCCAVSSRDRWGNRAMAFLGPDFRVNTTTFNEQTNS